MLSVAVALGFCPILRDDYMGSQLPFTNLHISLFFGISIDSEMELLSVRTGSPNY